MDSPRKVWALVCDVAAAGAWLDELYSEEMSHGLEAEDVRIINPPDEL